MNSLFTTFPLTIQTEFANLMQSAQTQETIHIGSPGSIEERTKGSASYFYHRFYDANGKLSEKYISGPSGEAEAELARSNTADNILHANALVGDVKMFRALKFSIIEDKAGATLAALHNHGLFAGGLTLIGSHAYGSILNNLGVQAQNFLTEDIDTVRSKPLSIATTPQMSLLNILQTSGLPFVKTKTELKPGGKSEAYKLPGKEKLLVDLLVNGTDIGVPVLVPELDAYAQCVPYLDYLVAGRTPSIVLSKNYVVPVFVPGPARFAVHKLFSAVSRINQPAKSEKDILQAATLICVLEDKYPGDIASAMADFPTAGKKLMLKGAERAATVVSKHSAESGEALNKAIVLAKPGI